MRCKSSTACNNIKTGNCPVVNQQWNGYIYYGMFTLCDVIQWWECANVNESCWHHMTKENLTILWGCEMVYKLLKMPWGFLRIFNTELLYDPAIPHLGTYPEEMTAKTQMGIGRYMVTARHYPQAPKVGASQVINKEMNKTWSFVHWNIIKAEKGNSNTCYSMDEPWRHCIKWNKPDTKEKASYDSSAI